MTITSAGPLGPKDLARGPQAHKRSQVKEQGSERGADRAMATWTNRVLGPTLTRTFPAPCVPTEGTPPVTARTDSLKTRRTLQVGDKSYDYFSLPAAAAAGLGDISRLPFSLKVLLENLLRFEDGGSVTVDDIKAMAAWLEARRSEREIAYRPARVLMQDLTGVPAVVDLASMRNAMEQLGGDPKQDQPTVAGRPGDRSLGHGRQLRHQGRPSRRTSRLEFQRNGERYAFLRWGQRPSTTSASCRREPESATRSTWSIWPGQWSGPREENGDTVIAYPDTLVGTDSHTTMINGLSVLGWGVGGIEAEAAMLGQPVSMVIPKWSA